MGLFDSFRRRSDAPEELPYLELASAELDRRAAALVRDSVMRVTHHATPDAPSLTIQGPCPRCGHVFSQTQQLNLSALAVRRADAKPGEAARWADFLCECRVAHPGALSDELGCGASFTLAVPKSET
ncbi:hypothetical protein OHJ16_02570 [Actinomyces israelii]|uniref:Uncharacterized protein n=1 Tax=Actinomyces israelii TaxID=1659 RepID=A0ABT4I739_9ACTO|nr:hypothetical protein [Actinomyces israelii]MCZ0856938.1 hypothetical protein [Actinomyces israelii]